MNEYIFQFKIIKILLIVTLDQFHIWYSVYSNTVILTKQAGLMTSNTCIKVETTLLLLVPTHTYTAKKQ